MRIANIQTDCNGVPKVIFNFWSQGWDAAHAPALVLGCHNSWKKHNPSYTVIQLDASSLSDGTFDAKLELLFANIRYLK